MKHASNSTNPNNGNRASRAVPDDPAAADEEETMTLYNVIAVNIDTGKKRLIAENQTERNAEAIVKWAVIRRGVEEEFFKTEEVK